MDDDDAGVSRAFSHLARSAQKRNPVTRRCKMKLEVFIQLYDR